MGICSYFLIGHYWETAEARAPHQGVPGHQARRRPVPVRHLVPGGTAPARFRISAVVQRAIRTGGHGHTAAGALLLLGGVAGKSAQFPLHTWLPDAMAGPTPVCALIHAATMVAAGIYVVARLLPGLPASPAALTVLA